MLRMDRGFAARFGAAAGRRIVAGRVIDTNQDRWNGAWSTAQDQRAPESRLSGQHSNPPRMAENAPEASITAVLPSSGPVRNCLLRRGFFFHFRVPLPKLGPLKAKWT